MTDNITAAMQRITAIRTTIASTSPPRAAAATAAAPQFSALLAAEMAESVDGHEHHDHALSDTRSTGAPPGLEAYSNGRIPVEALAPIPGGEYLWAPAAQAFTAMSAAAARDGITLGVTDAYRPYEDQVRLADELGLYSQGGWAAVPGTSQHGWGRAVDVQLDDEGVAWMRANAARFGFAETVPREPWHWEYHG